MHRGAKRTHRRFVMPRWANPDNPYKGRRRGGPVPPFTKPRLPRRPPTGRIKMPSPIASGSGGTSGDMSIATSSDKPPMAPEEMALGGFMAKKMHTKAKGAHAAPGHFERGGQVSNGSPRDSRSAKDGSRISKHPEGMGTVKDGWLTGHAGGEAHPQYHATTREKRVQADYGTRTPKRERRIP